MNDLIINLITTSVIVCINVFIGWQVWRSHRHNLSNQFFLLLITEICAWILFNYFSRATADGETFLLFARFVMVATAPVPLTIYFFANTFPNKKLTFSKLQIKIFATWGIFCALFNLAPFTFPHYNVVDGVYSPAFGWGIIVTIINLVTFSFLSILEFIKKTRHAVGLEKIRLRYIYIIIAFTIICAIFFNFVLPLFFQNVRLINVGTTIASLTATGLLGYIMLRTRFTGLNYFIAVTAYYFLIAIWIIIYLLSFYLITNNFDNSILSLAFNLPIFIIWLLLFLFIYNHAKDYLIKKVVNHGLDWEQEKKQFFKQITKEINFQQIITQTLDFLAILIKNKGNAIIGDFAEENKIIITDALKSRHDSDELKQLYHESDLIWKHQPPSPIIYEEIIIAKKKDWSKIINLMRHNRLSAIFPIAFYNDIKGILVMSQKKSLSAYYIQDINVVSKIIEEVSPALNRAVTYANSQNFANFLQRKIKRATAELIKANEKLIIADKLKDEFVSVASHELRTPMTAIKNYLWLVQKHNTPDKIKENSHYLQIAINSTDRLISLVNDMLTISRIESNRFNLDLQELNLVDLLAQVRNELLPIAKQKKLTLNLEVANNLYPIVADANKILEVLHNLVGNAIKFTNQGTVTIKCTTKSKQNFCHIIDTGMGIDRTDYSKLFRKFTRLEKSYVKIKETGTGLGLYVSREIMRRHGGDIVFKSTFGKGSTFTIIFPKH